MDLSTFMYLQEGGTVRYDGLTWTVKRKDIRGHLVIRHESGETERIHHKEAELVEYGATE